MTEGLFPPAGAEPGSEWLIYGYPEDHLGSLAVEWTGAHWCSNGHIQGGDPEDMADLGYTLDDPHGLAAAHRVMSEARLQLPAYEMLGADGRGADVWQATGFDVAGDEIIGTGPSALAAALDAVRKTSDVR